MKNTMKMNKMRRTGSIFALLFAAGTAFADVTLNVTDTASLNNAIAQANAAASGNTVTINLTSDITLTSNLTNIALASGVNLVINGGAGIDLSGNNLSLIHI